MVSIVCKSIKAQRTGNWLLHLEAVSEMLPFFASGHYHYHFQSMYKLETTHPVIFNNFKDNGLHVIRRSDTYWSGLSSDLIIEQVLMRSMKTSGGLTRGRGMGEVQRNLTGVRYESSDQHESHGPTSTAAKFHPLRVYFQVQSWLGRDGS